MQTVDKAMRLLGYFSAAMPELGLSELARRARFDKAGTRRLLVALTKHGFIEQDPHTRRYRLGAAFLGFAHIREATRPLASIVRSRLEAMVAETGETAHASLLSGDQMTTLCIVEPRRPTRVSVDPAVGLPLHATASGLACLAFAPQAWLREYSSRALLRRYTARTCVSTRRLRAMLVEIRTRGYSLADRSFDDEVVSIAAPVFDAERRAFAAISVASIASRFDRTAERRIAGAVLSAAAETTETSGGALHPALAVALAGRRA
jgi:IclR family transcriptional regulator, acetate operon repressor